MNLGLIFPDLPLVPGNDRKALSQRCERRRMSFAAPYLALIDEQSPQRRYSMREVFNALRWLVAGSGRCALAAYAP